MLDAIGHTADDNFSFTEIALRLQHSPTAAALSTNTAFEWKLWFSCFPVLPGGAEAQVIWGGIVKRLLFAYFIGNISTKNYQNPFMYVKVIASLSGTFFETHCIQLYTVSQKGTVCIFAVVVSNNGKRSQFLVSRSNK